MGPPNVSVRSNLGAFGLVLGQKLKLVAPCKRDEIIFIATCKGHDTVVSLSAGDDKTPAEA
jgi:hypothetical protein